MRLKIGRPVALAISFITVYNLRMLEMFRYGTSLENYRFYVDKVWEIIEREAS